MEVFHKYLLADKLTSNLYEQAASDVHLGEVSFPGKQQGRGRGREDRKCQLEWGTLVDCVAKREGTQCDLLWMSYRTLQ